MKEIRLNFFFCGRKPLSGALCASGTEVLVGAFRRTGRGNRVKAEKLDESGSIEGGVGSGLFLSFAGAGAVLPDERTVFGKAT